MTGSTCIVIPTSPIRPCGNTFHEHAVLKQKRGRTVAPLYLGVGACARKGVYFVLKYDPAINVLYVEYLSSIDRVEYDLQWYLTGYVTS